MGRLAQTDGLTDIQTEILKTVRGFVEKEILPHAPRWSAPTSTRRTSSRA